MRPMVTCPFTTPSSLSRTKRRTRSRPQSVRVSTSTVTNAMASVAASTTARRQRTRAAWRMVIGMSVRLPDAEMQYHAVEQRPEPTCRSAAVEAALLRETHELSAAGAVHGGRHHVEVLGHGRIVAEIHPDRPDR